MPSFGPNEAEALVFTFKEGVLSSVAHDLKLRVTSFRIDVDEQARRVDATFDAGSLRVVSAMKDGRENPGALSGADVKKIEQHLREQVLHPARHPSIRFQGTVAEEGTLLGRLRLHGLERDVRGTWRALPEGRVAEVELNQPSFGIEPFRALLGALRIQPQVRVRVRLPPARLP